MAGMAVDTEDQESRLMKLMRMEVKSGPEAEEDLAALSNLKKASSQRLETAMATPDKRLDDLHMLMETDAEAGRIEAEVAQAELESRLRRMITDVLRPSIAKVTKLQTDHEMMCTKFQEMIDGHQEVLSAQHEAKETSQMIGVFRSKLDEFWASNVSLEDKLTQYQRSAGLRMEELEHNLEANRNSSERLGRNLDRAMQDADRVKNNIKAMQVNFERATQKNKERMDTEVKQLHGLIQEVRDMHHKLQIEVWGPEDCSESSPPSLRKLDMQMRTQTGLVSESINDIAVLQGNVSELFTATQRQSGMELQLKDLHDKSMFLAERVESCAQEAKEDFKQASNLMAAFSANLVREARHSFKDELKHAQQMQQEVDEFVRRTQAAIVDTETSMNSLSGQLQAMVKEIRTDLDSYDQKRKRDKQGLEDQVRQLQSKVNYADNASESIIKGLEHVSGVISMSLQSERMSVALDLQDFVERKDTPYVGVRGTRDKKRQPRTVNGKPTGLDPDALHRIEYQPQPVHYQGTNFERPQLLALREKLVHIAQEVLQKGPDLTPKQVTNGAPDLFSQHMPTGITGRESRETRSSTPSGVGIARPGSRGQPGARGSPLRDFRDLAEAGGSIGHPERGSGQVDIAHLEAWSRNSSKGADFTMGPNAAPALGVTSAVADDAVQLPVLASFAKDKANMASSKNSADLGSAR
jgi:hypothetical protein